MMSKRDNSQTFKDFGGMLIIIGLTAFIVTLTQGNYILIFMLIAMGFGAYYLGQKEGHYFDARKGKENL